jgi:hypothetical protein
MIQSDSGSAQSGFGLGQASVTCGLTRRRQALAANFLGLKSSSQIETIVGQVTVRRLRETRLGWGLLLLFWGLSD